VWVHVQFLSSGKSGQGKVGREKLKKEWSLFQGNVNPNSNESLIRESSGRCCCARVLSFLQESGQGKVGREKLKKREESLSGSAS
jgi:hypothetical protein